MSNDTNVNNTNASSPGKNPVEARQGTDRPKLIYVLGAGVILVLIAFAVVWGLQG